MIGEFEIGRGMLVPVELKEAKAPRKSPSWMIPPRPIRTTDAVFMRSSPPVVVAGLYRFADVFILYHR